MEEYAEIILRLLEEKASISSDEIPIPYSCLHGVLLSLESKNQIVFEIKEKHKKVLTDEGKDLLEYGSQEYNLFNSIGDNGSDISILEKFPLGANYAFKNKWIRADKERVYRNKEAVEDSVVKQLSALSVLTEKEFSDLKKRKLVDQSKTNIYIISKGSSYGIAENCDVELTAEIVANYQGQKFKKYNFNTVGNIPNCGSLHPLMKIGEEFKKIFIEMGFAEMKTNRYVESSFWNFDSLFQPQCHPARDAHDTFFLKNPEFASSFDDEEYLKRVQDVHESGGFGSKGHQSVWDRREAMKNILRTHTTSVSSRYLKDLASNFRPVKLFSIDKVFRNESVDATHLAEFHQVEGLIAGENITLGDLMGFMGTFFEKLGLKNIKFKPAFNPYTEPSMEVFGYHEGLKKWIEIGNSGIFRPEMLGPMGFDESVTVIAWGLSLERPAMIKYGLNNIRDLVGHKVDINFIKKCKIIHF